MRADTLNLEISTRFSMRNLWKNDGILSFFINKINLKLGGFVFIFFFVIFPLVFSSYVTSKEGRLLGGLDEEIAVAILSQEDYSQIPKHFVFKKPLKITVQDGKNYYFISVEKLEAILKNDNAKEFYEYLEGLGRVESVRIKGMSYFGDPMVFPFYFFVFFALIFIRKSTKKITKFFSNSYMFLRIDDSFNKEKFLSILSEVEACIHYDGYWRFIKYGGVIFGLSFIFWNAVTCTYPDVFHPYNSAKVYLLDGSMDVVHLQTKVDIPKWDTDIEIAPFSWFAARLWVSFGYFLIPIILAKLLTLIIAVFIFCLRIGENNFLLIRPVSEEDAGRFSSLSDVALSFVWVIIPFLFMALAAFMKEATPPSFHNYLLIIGFIPIFLMVFLMPIYSFQALREFPWKPLDVVFASCGHFP